MISITGMWVSLGVLGMFAAAGIIWFAVKMRDRALTPEDIEAAAFIHDMHEANTGGLMALPEPGTTVKIPPRDQREVTRVIVHHEQGSNAGITGVTGEFVAPDHRGPGWPVNGAPADVPGREHGPADTAVVAPGTPPAGDHPQASGPAAQGISQVHAAGPEHQPPAAADPIPLSAAAGPEDPATMTGPDYLAWVTERSEWEHETSWFSAIEAEA